MGEENQNNQSSSSPGSQAADNNGTLKPVKTSNGSTNSAVGSGKRPKTEKQIIRERERRRRRRKKKADNLQVPPSVVVSSKKAVVIPETHPTVAPTPAEPIIEPVVESPVELTPKIEEQLPTHLDSINEESEFVGIPQAEESAQPTPQILNELDNQNPQNAQADNLFPETAKQDDERSSAENDTFTPAESAPLFEEQLSDKDVVDSAAQNPEELPVFTTEDHSLDEKHNYTEDSDSIPEDESLLVEEQPIDLREDDFEKANQDKAKEIHQSLLENQASHLEELPIKQGFLGKLFDKLTALIQGRKSPGLQQELESNEKIFINEVPSPVSSKFKSILVGAVKLIIILALIIGAFCLGSSLKVVDRIAGIFAPDKSKIELAIGDNAKVVYDQEMIKRWGFQAVQLFGKNLGNINDLTYNVFFNTNYFGKLKDPIFYGETGITAAIYYGFSLEAAYVKNRFIYYTQYISKVANANRVKLEDVMKRKVRRDEALDDYLKESQEIFNQGNILRKEINLQLDDLKISLNSLEPDKNRYEADFFSTMAQYNGEKADNLLTKFIEAGQKQVELKAKINALQKLLNNYETELLKLKLRLEAINKNKEALISGITITETPNVNLNLIRE